MMRAVRKVIVCATAMALGFAFVFASSAGAAGLLVADGGFGGVLEIEEQTVDVVVNNGIAVTTVEQRFRNTEDRIVEALYTFPTPHGASVSSFSMWINGKEMVGEVVEKARAKEIYESYKARNVDPGLLEQVDFKTFEMRIYPIPAGGQQRVKISYYQQLDVDHDWATYVYPLATATRRDIDQQTVGRFAFSLRVLSQVPISELSSPSHPDAFVIAERSKHFYEASLESPTGDLSEDVVLAFRTQRPQTGVDMITSQPVGEDGYFMLTVTAGEELEQLNAPMDYVFILDVSGSMANDGKLGLSRQSLNAFVEALSPEDRFEVMTFNVEPTVLFGNLVAVNDESLETAAGFLESQQARGGTELRHAVRAAYAYGDPDRRLNVVILSDGMTETRSRRELLELIEEKPEQGTVFAIGVGNEVDRPLLTQLAEEAGGLAEFISRGDNFDRKAQAFRRKLTRPVAQDVAIRIQGAGVYDVVPTRLPNLYHGAPVRLFGRYRKPRKPREVQVELSAEVLGRPFRQTRTIVKLDGDNPEIERMWASARIAQLLRDADRRGNRPAVKAAVVDLGERYSVVTEYTSFIVLENDSEYRRWKIKRRNVDRLERDERKQTEIRDQLERMREESTKRLGPRIAQQTTKQLQQSAPKKFTSQKQSHGGSNVTPEPSSHLLMWAGLMGLLLSRRRSRRVLG